MHVTTSTNSIHQLRRRWRPGPLESISLFSHPPPAPMSLGSHRDSHTRATQAMDALGGCVTTVERPFLAFPVASSHLAVDKLLRSTVFWSLEDHITKPRGLILSSVVRQFRAPTGSLTLELSSVQFFFLSLFPSQLRPPWHLLLPPCFTVALGDARNTKRARAGACVAVPLRPPISCSRSCSGATDVMLLMCS